MRIPLGWLKEFVDYQVGQDELILKLTMAGLEVEGVESVSGDTIIEVNVTPNRPDCLSVLGIAREVSALLHVPLRLPELGGFSESGDCDVRVEIPDEDLCHRYAGRVIRNVRISDSPEWMRKRLEQCGMRAINNIVDITNYVLLEMGHPLHAFDLAKIAGQLIRVKKTEPGGTIRTLDGADRLLPDQALLIWDSARPVAIAGVMGGVESEVSSGTRDVFLESAYFSPPSVRRTSKGLGLKTESSYRFERGTDIEFLESALNRAALLMAELAGGTVSRIVDAYPKKFVPRRITVRHNRVNSLLGTSLSGSEMAGFVRRLGIGVEEHSDRFDAVPPSHRDDLRKEIDIIEEVARLYGYDNIPVKVPKMRVSEDPGSMLYRRIGALKQHLRMLGYTEVINYSFMNSAHLDLLTIPENDQRRKTIAIRNPIKSDECHLRTSLVPSLIQNLLRNVSTGSRAVRIFEFSRVYRSAGEILPRETHSLGMLCFEERGPALWRDDTPDFYAVKGIIESLLTDMRIRKYSCERSSEPYLHPGKSADIFVAGEKIGSVGVLHPGITERLDLKTAKPEIVVGEIDVDILLPLLPAGAKYSPLPRYPSIERDIAIIIDAALSAASVLDKVKSYPAELIEDVTLFDLYQGKNIPEGKKSIAFSIRYRAKDRTLTDAEIEELHRRIVSFVSDATGGVVRAG